MGMFLEGRWRTPNQLFDYEESAENDSRFRIAQTVDCNLIEIVQQVRVELVHIVQHQQTLFPDHHIAVTEHFA